MVDADQPKSANVLITGANRGIGLRLAQQYAQEGWRVLACCREPELAEELQRTGAEVHRLDVNDATSIARLAEELGDTPIDLLINNAGARGGERKAFGDIDYAVWEDTLITNTIGPYRVSEALLENVARSNGKTIANISSRLGSITLYETGNEYIYRSSKTALNMVTHDLAIDLAPRGITVLAFHPGWVSTDMGGPQAPLGPAESARAIRRCIAVAEFSDSGSFLNHDGSRLPW